jgi:nucleoside-diphosphate kinase
MTFGREKRVDQTLVIVKPDGVQRALIGEIIGRLEKRGLKVVALKMVQISQELGEQHYSIHRERPFFDELVQFISSSPVVVGVLEGPKAVEVTRNTVGATNPVDAAPGSIRGTFGLTIGQNLIHASDSPESARREIDLFFSPEEIVSYDRNIDHWIAG